MKKVLVIGGAGYIGGRTTDLLVNKGFDVAIYDKLFYEKRYLKDVRFYFGDIRDTDYLVQVSRKFDVIIFLAALVGDPACSIDTKLTEEINYLAVKNAAKLIPKDKHIIFMSTCSVYGAQDGLLNEDSPTNPLSAYAKTKLMAEKYILERNGTVFRLGTVFGLGDSHSRIRMDLVVNVLAMKAFKYKEITINGGEQWRPIIAVEDIANYLVEASETKPSGIFILSKENVTIKSLGERIAKIIPGTKINYSEISFQDARNYKVDNKKSQAQFKYKARVEVEDEVKNIVKIFQEKRIKNVEDNLYHNGAYIFNNLKEIKNER